MRGREKPAVMGSRTLTPSSPIRLAVRATSWACPWKSRFPFWPKQESSRCDKILRVQEAIGIFALLVAAIGWYYLFYSRAAQKLGSIEEEQTNRRRGTLRRVNAVIMLLMAVGIAT